jgi:hypothetical protein
MGRAAAAGPRPKFCSGLDANGLERTIYVAHLRRPAGDALSLLLLYHLQ